MPVTLKLSKEFYDKFGEQVANEFVDAFNQVDATYRSDLRELNESNFARFDARQELRFARFEQKFAKLESDVGQRIGKLASDVGQRLAAFEAIMERRFNEQARFMLLGWGTTIAAILGAALLLK